MSALGHIVLGWLVGLLTGYLLNPLAGFFVAALVGFVAGAATVIIGLGLDYLYDLRRTNHADHS